MSNPNIQELITLPDDGQESMKQDESVVPSGPRAATASSRRLDPSTIYFRMVERETGAKISVWESNKSINGPLQSIERDKSLKQAIGEVLSYFDQHRDTYQAEKDNTIATIQTMITDYNTEKKKRRLGLGIVPVNFSAFRQAGYTAVDDGTLRLCRAAASRAAAPSWSGGTDTTPPPSLNPTSMGPDTLSSPP